MEEVSGIGWVVCFLALSRAILNCDADVGVNGPERNCSPVGNQCHTGLTGDSCL